VRIWRMELTFFSDLDIPTGYVQAVQKRSDARRAISGGMRHTFSYAAVKTMSATKQMDFFQGPVRACFS
jgi:hypothetical protein